MKFAGWVGAVVVMAAGVAGAQIPNVPSSGTVNIVNSDPMPLVMQAAKARWEYGAFVQGGVGLEERTDFSFLSAGGQLGRR